MDAIIQTLRKPVAKIVTRLILYGLVVIFGQAAATDETIIAGAGQLGDGLVAVAVSLLIIVIEKRHHDADIAEPPKSKSLIDNA